MRQLRKYLNYFLNMQLIILHLHQCKWYVLKTSADPERPDGVGSVRRMGIGPIKPLQEQITVIEPNQRIEYKIIKNPLIKHHLGTLEFQQVADHKTLVTYRIELQARVPFVSKAILAQLKTAIKIGLSETCKISLIISETA